MRTSTWSSAGQWSAWHLARHHGHFWACAPEGASSPCDLPEAESRYRAAIAAKDRRATCAYEFAQGDEEAPCDHFRSADVEWAIRPYGADLVIRSTRGEGQLAGRITPDGPQWGTPGVSLPSDIWRRLERLIRALYSRWHPEVRRAAQAALAAEGEELLSLSPDRRAELAEQIARHPQRMAAFEAQVRAAQAARLLRGEGTGDLLEVDREIRGLAGV